MITRRNFTDSVSFSRRKIIHYSLIFCILLIQLTIAAFFYNEFVNRKHLSFIEKQLSQVRALEDVTAFSRKELELAQNHFQKFLVNENPENLDAYFKSMIRLSKSLDSITLFKNANPRLNYILTLDNKNTKGVGYLKALIDSSFQISTVTREMTPLAVPKIKNFTFDHQFDQYETEKKTYSDSLEKQGIFSRLKDAITGEVKVKRDSTVITMKQGKAPDFKKIKTELDSVVQVVNNHYFSQIKKIVVQSNTADRNMNADSKKYYGIFNNLLVYSSGLMNVYENAVKDSKAELEQEILKRNSKSEKIRNMLVLGLLFLMFGVSVLIMFFTRIAFIYERRLSAANVQINENLVFKNRILGMLSHELRSPLKIIGIFLKRISSKTEDETVKKYLKSISFTNNTLLMQANQILEYTKNQQVENKLKPEVFNLKNELRSILEAIEPYIETRNNKLFFTEDIPHTMDVFSDCTKMNQLFMNFLGNANKFTENGTIKVHIYTEPVNTETVSMVTTITDTGSGISEADLEKIFEPYYQGLISHEIDNLGAGLGLSLSKELIDLYGGNVVITSKQYEGTTVVFNLNLKINDASK